MYMAEGSESAQFLSLLLTGGGGAYPWDPRSISLDASHHIHVLRNNNIYGLGVEI